MPDTPRLLAAALVLFLYAALCARIAWTQRRQRQARQQQSAALAAPGIPALIVAYASQTGCAEDLAWQTAQQLQQAGQPAQVLPLAALTAETMQQAAAFLFIASTSGEGDAPDHASPFLRRLQAPLSLQGRRYGLLALGDSSYRQFCGFGRRLDACLQQQGAQALFERIEVDRLDAQALQRWWEQLRQHFHVSGAAVATPAEEHAAWTLTARQHLNPGSAGAPLFLLTLTPPAGQEKDHLTWEAGDLALVLPPGETRAREYSIASLPEEGRLQLIVRQRQETSGALGKASGWLCREAALGTTIALRLRRNPAFRLGDNCSRPMILIGNGSGIAGLRAHLKARAAAGAGPNWLLFGERSAQHDLLFPAELQTWQENRVLQRLDRAFSRDQTSTPYVQDSLQAAAVQLREWMAQDSSIYVCGNRQGMAAGVDGVLRHILGDEAVDELLAQGRYRRDVY